jgi:hypothetical protein
MGFSPFLAPASHSKQYSADFVLLQPFLFDQLLRLPCRTPFSMPGHDLTNQRARVAARIPARRALIAPGAQKSENSIHAAPPLLKAVTPAAPPPSAPQLIRLSTITRNLPDAI